jgi:hypothetical protein
LCTSAGKPIALSFFGRREKVEELQRTGVFPVFNDPMESVRAMRMFLDREQKPRQGAQGLFSETTESTGH